MSDGIVTDLSYWCEGLNERLTKIREIIRALPAGWSIADRIQGVQPSGGGQSPSTLKAMLSMAKDIHGKHARWPEVQKLITEIEADIVIYEAVLRLLSKEPGV